MNNNTDKVVNQKLSKHEFYFETPLYTSVDLANADQYLFSGEVDAYSPKNHIDTIYEVLSQRVDTYGVLAAFYVVRLKCKRKQNDTLVFFVWVGDSACVKIGQLPSLADIQFAELGKKYDKLLSRSDLQEFKKAIGLAAHGVGAGSFIYLRRIFEKLIDETYTQNQVAMSMSSDDYMRLRMDEKVELLKSLLPTQLVEMKGIYKILSSGVHNLSEQQCMKYFPAMKLSIELILDQRIENESKAKKDAAVKAQLQQIQTELGNSQSS